MPLKDPEARRAYQVAYDLAHRDELRAAKRAYYIAHRDEISEADRTYRRTHPEKERAQRAAHYAAHRDEIKASQAAWRATHPEIHRARATAWYDAHPEEARATRAAYHVTHRIEARERGRKSKALRRGAPLCDHASCLAIGPATLALRTAHSACYLCGTAVDEGVDLAMDHVLPIKRGGLHCAENLRPACISCNSRKGSLTPEEYRAKLAS